MSFRVSNNTIKSVKKATKMVEKEIVEKKKETVVEHDVNSDGEDVEIERTIEKSIKRKVMVEVPAFKTFSGGLSVAKTSSGNPDTF